jgi:hypothetical protein
VALRAATQTAAERGKFDNFLQKMKGLKVIRSGESKGEWVFNLRMVRLYIWLQSPEKSKGTRAAKKREST